MMKLVVCVVVVIQMMASYGADTNKKVNHIRLLWAENLSSVSGDLKTITSKAGDVQVVMSMRHGATSCDGHSRRVEFSAQITPEALQQAKEIGDVLRNPLELYNFLFYTDSTPRSEGTMQGVLGDGARYDKPKELHTNELCVGLKESDFRFIKECPGTLFGIVKQFKQCLPNTPQGDLNFVKNTLDDLGMSVEANGLNTLTSFLNVIFGANMPLNVFSDVIKEVKVVSIPTSLQSTFDAMINRLKTGKNLFCIQHSMFISSVMFFTKLHEMLHATSIADVYEKMNANIKANPAKYLSDYLDLFIACFTKYHIHNLDLLYMLYSYDSKNRKHNFYVCDLDYVKRNNLPLYEVLAPATSTPILRKCFSLLCAICKEPLKFLPLILSPDPVKKKGCFMSVKLKKDEAASVSAVSPAVEQNNSLSTPQANITESKSIGYIAVCFEYVKYIFRWLWNSKPTVSQIAQA